MLVTFRTKAYANITMFGDVAKQLLTLMGHSGTIQSALTAKDVPAALARLEAAIAQRKAAEADDAPAETERERDADDAPRKVVLSQRAVPLLELLRAAGHPDLADEVERELIGRNVVTGRWTFQLVEEYDEGYYETFRRIENDVRTRLMEGRRHVHEAEMKERRRTHGLPGHTAVPGDESRDGL